MEQNKANLFLAYKPYKTHKDEDQKEDSLEEFLMQYREHHTEKEVQQMMHRITILPAVRSYTYHKDGLKAICHPGDVVEYKKLNKTSGKVKRNIFVCTSVNFDGKDKQGNYCAAENHIGYDNGKGNGNRKAKFCHVLDSGCLQCTGIEKTDQYLAEVQVKQSSKNNKAHKDLIPMSFSFCSDGFQ